LVHSLKAAPTTSPARRWARRKEARPAELLAAALELFVERGFAGTRLDDVAARAGVSKGTLYLYFENKEELFKALVRENIGQRLSAARAELAAFEGSSRDLLHRLIHGWWSDYGASPAGGLTKLMMAESGNFPAITRFFVEEAIEPWHQLAAGVICRGIERGDFRSVNVEAFVEVLTASMVMLSLWTRSFGPLAARPVDATHFIDTLHDMALSALTVVPRQVTPRPPAKSAAPDADPVAKMRASSPRPPVERIK
jgi:AcrR family transcriptional regulator